MNAVDRNGWTVMHIILGNCFGPNHQEEDNLGKEFVQLFIDYGAHLKIKDINGISVLDLCKESEIGDFVFEYLSKKRVPELKSKTFTLKNCIICENPRQDIFAFLPCGHANSCELCCMKFDYSRKSNSKCSLCRELITDYKKIYI